MKNMSKFLLAVAATLAVAACETDNLDTYNGAQNAQPSGNAFDNALYSGYRDLATEEQNPYGEYVIDAADRDAYSVRAMAAARGETVLPETVGARELPPGSINDVTNGRRRLVAALDASGRTKAPQAAARAQVMFDCWVEQLEENYQPQDIARCRQGFENALAEVEDALKPPPPVAVDRAEPFLVFFDFDKSDITAESARVIRQAADRARATGAASIQLIGHADRAGSPAYNDKLSVRRANAVAAQLRSNGVSSNAISVEGRGESDPLVPTADGVQEPQNRRVEGIWIYR